MDPQVTSARQIESLSEFVLRGPSIMGRLATAASLYNDQSLRYERPLAPEIDADTVDSELRAMHAGLFIAWLSLSLQRKAADLRIFKDSSRENGSFRECSGMDPLEHRLIPPSALAVERELFIAEMAILKTFAAQGDYATMAF